MYTTECSKTGCLQETEESSGVDVLPTGEGVLIIDEVKVTIKLQYLFSAHLIVQYSTPFNT